MCFVDVMMLNVIIVVLFTVIVIEHVSSFRISPYPRILTSRHRLFKSHAAQSSGVNTSPIAFFVNGKSGDVSGVSKLNETLHKVYQKVCNLNTEQPVATIKSLLSDLSEKTHKTKKNKEDLHATALCIGGDGTIKWVMDETEQLLHNNNNNKLNQSTDAIRFGLIPSGTGNDFNRHLMKLSADELSKSDMKRLKQQLEYCNLQSVNLFTNNNTACVPFDRWQVNIEPYNAEYQLYSLLKDSVGADKANSLWQQLYCELQAKKCFQIPSPPSPAIVKTFNNYFGIGVDSQVTYTFSQWRKQFPNLFSRPMINRLWYGVVWCYVSIRHWNTAHLTDYIKITTSNSSKKKVVALQNALTTIDNTPTTTITRVFNYLFNTFKNMLKGNQSILRGLVFANIGSFAGGGVLWPSVAQFNQTNKEPLQPQHSDDGKLELTGLSTWWHLALVTFKLDNGIAISQRSGFDVDCSTEGLPMQVDGEAWIQKEPCHISVKPLSKVNVLIPRLPTTTEKKK